MKNIAFGFTLTTNELKTIIAEELEIACTENNVELFKRELQKRAELITERWKEELQSVCEMIASENEDEMEEGT